MTSTDAAVLPARRRNGLPVERPRDGRHWAWRVLTNPWLWAVLGFTLVFAGALWWMYDTTTADQVTQVGTIPGLNQSAIRRSASLALPTVAVWIVLFLAIDRFRPMRPALWCIALGWGGAVATSLSMVINTWASQQMAVVGNGDPAQAARAAVFVAPFVEEATKATILFWIAMALRSRLVSPTQAVALGGLSGAGFAFVENILYYARVVVYASGTIDAGDPDAALNEIVLMRGVKTAFGHPLFTSLVAVGLIVGLRSRSKVVRILAPVTGYLTAALAHMVFNFLASSGIDTNLMAVFGWLLVLTLLFRLFRAELAEGRRHRAHLEGFVQAGWLPWYAPQHFSRQRTRWRAVLNAASRGPRAFLATLRLQRTVSELVHVRDAELRGLVDEAATGRERELLVRAFDLAPRAVIDPRVQKFRWPPLRRWWGNLRALVSGWRSRRRPGPIGDWRPPAQVGAGPLGSPGYSPVDPRWAPPKG